MKTETEINALCQNQTLILAIWATHCPNHTLPGRYRGRYAMDLACAPDAQRREAAALAALVSRYGDRRPTTQSRGSGLSPKVKSGRLLWPQRGLRRRSAAGSPAPANRLDGSGRNREKVLIISELL